MPAVAQQRLRCEKSSGFIQAAEAIVESPSPKFHERFRINVLTRISFHFGRQTNLSLIDGGKGMLQPLQLRCTHVPLSM